MTDETRSSHPAASPDASPPALETAPQPLALETTPDTPALEAGGEPAPAAPPPEPTSQMSRSQRKASGTRRRKQEAATASEAAAAPAAEPKPAGPEETAAPSPASGNKKWYVIKVKSGQEESIKTAIERKIRIEGLEQYVGQIVIPYEEIVLKKTVKVKDKKTGEMVPQEKKVIKKQKKFPGYLFAELEINDRLLYLFRETSGVGDFVGARARREPTPMTEREIQQLLTGVALPGDRKKLAPRQIVKLDFEKGDKVRIREGAFAGMEGEVKAISEARDEGDTPKVTVVVTVFGRPVDVTVDYWQVDKA